MTRSACSTRQTNELLGKRTELSCWFSFFSGPKSLMTGRNWQNPICRGVQLPVRREFTSLPEWIGQNTFIFFVYHSNGHPKKLKVQELRRGRWSNRACREGSAARDTREAAAASAAWGGRAPQLAGAIARPSSREVRIRVPTSLCRLFQ